MTHAIPEYTVDQLEAAGRIELDHFTSEDAFELGTLAAAVTQEWGVSLSVDIVIDGYLVYRARLGKTGPGNDPWLAGKAAVVEKFGEPSLLVRRRHEEAGTPFVDDETFKAHGGSMPIRVNGELVGTITTSGEPDVIDHTATAEAVRRFLGR